MALIHALKLLRAGLYSFVAFKAACIAYIVMTLFPIKIVTLKSAHRDFPSVSNTRLLCCPCLTCACTGRQAVQAGIERCKIFNSPMVQLDLITCEPSPVESDTRTHQSPPDGLGVSICAPGPAVVRIHAVIDRPSARKDVISMNKVFLL